MVIKMNLGVKNNRGWIRIAEASLAIILVLGTLIILSNRTNVNYSPDLSGKIEPLLEKIASNELLRDKIIKMNNDQSENVLHEYLNAEINDSSLDFEVKVCNVDDYFCPLKEYPDTNVYTKERIISSTLDEISPKRLKIFLWKRT